MNANAPPTWQFHFLPQLAPPRTLHEQLRLIERLGTWGYLGSWVTGLLLGILFFRIDATTPWLIWMLAHTALIVAMQQFRQYSKRNKLAPESRARWLMLGTGFTGAIWGYITVVAHLYGGDLPTLFMVSAVVAGVTAGALGFCGHCLPVYQSYLLFAVPLTSLGFLLNGDPLAVMFALFSISYFLFLLAFARYFETSTLNSIRLRFENRELIERMREHAQAAQDARLEAERALALAESHSQDKSRFLAAASHDLRQPIHAMGLFLEVLGATELTEKQRAVHTNATLACEASRTMLGTLLDFSRLDAGVVPFHPVNFELQSLLCKLCLEYAPQAEEKGLFFRQRDTPWAAFADPALVALVVRNLISNAIRYTHSGGILVACRKSGSCAIIEVWDTGIGIATADHERIFKEFLQLENPERDRTKGLGLGLAIVQGLCRVMGSQVSLRSTPGQGSVFRLHLPLATGAVVRPEAAVSVTPHSLLGLRLLVVEDESAIRLSMQQLLESWGCVCTAVASLDEALQLSAAIAPDVLITDYRLRGAVTGRDVIVALRHRYGQTLPCVIVTGDTAPDRLRDAQDTGAVLLHKPIETDRLKAELMQIQIQIRNGLRNAKPTPPP